MKVKSHARGTVLILLDCDDACPADLGPDLLRRAQAARSDVPFLVVLARREYETWFLAAARSLRGVAGLGHNLEPPPDPEAIRGAKEWLSKRMPGGYDPVAHQLLLTERFSLSEASNSPSFLRFKDRFLRIFA